MHAFNKHNNNNNNKGVLKLHSAVTYTTRIVWDSYNVCEWRKLSLNVT